MEKNGIWSTAVFLINIMFSSGALIVPPVVVLAGIGLSTLYLVVVGTISCFACLYIVESIAIANALKNHQQGELSNHDSEKEGTF
jgi:hypothetical protein